MPQTVVEALVLETREYRESSLLVTLLTRERGRLGAMAKGARRRKSTLAAVLQPFAHVRAHLSIRASGGLANLISADSIERPDFSRQKRGADAYGSALARVAYAGLFAEVLTHSHENDPHSEELFDLARVFFLGLETAQRPGSFALRGYFALLAALGFGLTSPAEPEIESPGYYFDLVTGLLRPGANPARSGLPAPGGAWNQFILSARAVDGLRQILGGASEAKTQTLNRGEGRALTRLATRLFETHLETRLRGARFLEEMVLGNP